MVWKNLKRRGLQPIKYKFTLTLKKFSIDSDKNLENVQISCRHGQRKLIVDPRPVRKNSRNEKKYQRIWSEFDVDVITFETTLFKNPKNGSFNKKKWKLVVKKVSANGKRSPLAAISLDISTFVNHVSKTSLNFDLRSLQSYVRNCSLSIDISSKIVKDGNVTNDTSVASVNLLNDSPSIDVEIEAETSLETHTETEIAEETALPVSTLPDAESIKDANSTLEASLDEIKETKIHKIAKPSPLPLSRQAWDKVKRARNHSQSSNQSRLSQASVIEESFQSLASEATPKPKALASPPPPEPKFSSISDEGLLSWCKDVTKDYKAKTSTDDLSRHLLASLGLAATLHRCGLPLSDPFTKANLFRLQKRLDLDFPGNGGEQRDVASNIRIVLQTKDSVTFGKAKDPTLMKEDVMGINKELKHLAAKISGLERFHRYVEKDLGRSYDIFEGHDHADDEEIFNLSSTDEPGVVESLKSCEEAASNTDKMKVIDERIAIVKQQINEITADDNQAEKTEVEMLRMNDLIQEYKTLIDKKSELTDILEEEKQAEARKQSIAATPKSLRGSHQSLITPQRFISWLKTPSRPLL